MMTTLVVRGISSPHFRILNRFAQRRMTWTLTTCRSPPVRRVYAAPFLPLGLLILHIILDPVHTVIHSILNLATTAAEAQEQEGSFHHSTPSCNRCGQRGHIVIGCRQPSTIQLFRPHSVNTSPRRRRGRGGYRGRRPYPGRSLPSSF